MEIINQSLDKDIDLNLFFKPEGKEILRFQESVIFAGDGIIFELVIGQIYHKISADKHGNLTYTFANPGINAYQATILMNKFLHDKCISLEIKWTTKGISISAFKTGNVQSRETTNGKLMKDILFIEPKSNMPVFHANNNELKTWSPMIHGEGQESVIPSSAITMWNELKDALDTLLSSEIKKLDDSFNLVIGLSLSAIVTGYESYCKRRFSEIENTGIVPNIEKLVKEFILKEDKDEIIKQLQSDKKKNIEFSITESFTNNNKNKINFQNFKNCSDAYKKGYGILFNEIMDKDKITNLKKIIKLRHRITHYSIFITEYNPDNARHSFQAGDEYVPFIPNIYFVQQNLKDFNHFIQTLHNSTLDLKM